MTELPGRVGKLRIRLSQPTLGLQKLPNCQTDNAQEMCIRAAASHQSTGIMLVIRSIGVNDLQTCQSQRTSPAWHLLCTRRRML